MANELKRKIHLDILLPSYLALMLEGRKTIDARMTQNAVPPFAAVSIDDKLLLKESGGSILGEAFVKDVKYIHFTVPSPDGIKAIFKEYNDRILATPDFRKKKANSRYVTLIWLKDVVQVPAREFKKKDPRAWVVLNDDQIAMIEQQYAVMNHGILQ